MDQPQEPATVQLDLNCLRSLFEEFLDPLRTDDPRADFYNVYRRQSENFDRDYVEKYSQDLDTSLLFAGLFSAVTATFVTSVQPNLEPDPNEVTAAYMQLLIHTMNNSLFPHADPNSVASASADRPPGIVAVQAILYASLAISLLAAFLATLGKQWINEYTRNHGTSTIEKSQARQRKLDALKDWRFHLVIESLPVMLQLALLLLGCALSIYLWTSNRAIAGVAIFFTLTGVALYAFFTIASTLSSTCPYRTPLSTAILFLMRGATALYHSGWPGCRHVRIHDIQRHTQDVENPQLRGVENPQPHGVGIHDYHFGGITVNPKDHGDARCVSWVLGSATDDDVVFHTTRFAVEMTLYPETAGILPPDVLVNHFLGFALDRRVVPEGLERTSMIGMALASVLSIQLCLDPRGVDLLRLCDDIRHYVNWISSSKSTFLPGVAVLQAVLKGQDKSSEGWDIFSDIPHHLPSTQKLCLSRTILQTVWRWRQNDRETVFDLSAVDSLCDRLMANGGRAIPTLKTNCFLIIAISLGAWADGVHKLFTPNTEQALNVAVKVFHAQLQESMRNQSVNECTLTSILSALAHLDPFRILGTAKWGFEWIITILGSGYPEDVRYRTTIQTMQLLETHLCTKGPDSPLGVQPTWIAAFVHFLSLCEGRYTADSPTCPRSIALYILSMRPESAHLNTSILPLLTLTLSPTHPLQLRSSALKAFQRFVSEWFSRRDTPGIDLQGLLQAVGDPFQFTPDPSLLDGQPIDATEYDSIITVVALIEFASLDQWRNCLPDSTFTSCEGFVATPGGRDLILECLSGPAATWPGFLDTDTKVDAATSHLQGLGHQITAEIIKEWARITGRLSGRNGVLPRDGIE